MVSNRYFMVLIIFFSILVMGCDGSGNGVEKPIEVADEPLVPARFQSLYTELEQQLDNFSATILSAGNGDNQPVIFAAELSTANANRGTKLLNVGALAGSLLMLDRLKSLGVEAVSVSIGFPMLYRNFHQSQEEFQAYLNFYKAVASAVKDAGLTLLVDSFVLFTQDVFTNLDTADFYSGLTLEEYRNGRLDVIRIITEHLAPDYLTVGNEPDVEAVLSGQVQLKNVEIYRDFVDFMLVNLSSDGIRDVKLGAGAGTWLYDYRSFITSLAELEELDYIDMHIYPVNLDFLPRAITIAEIARSAGKQVAVGEAWLYKAGENELGSVTDADIFSRDAFSFWQPLDVKFMAVLVNLARIRQFAFVSFFWTKYLFAYLDYEESRDLGAEEIFALSDSRAASNIVINQFSILAPQFSQLIQ